MYQPGLAKDKFRDQIAQNSERRKFGAQWDHNLSTLGEREELSLDQIIKIQDIGHEFDPNSSVSGGREPLVPLIRVFGQ